MPYRKSFRRSSRLHVLLIALSLAACIGPAHAARNASADVSTSQLAMQVNDDRITLSMARVPQIYLYGPIDPDAPLRFESLIKSGRIRPGSDVYLNSPGGSVSAGIALGRLFRQAGLATHLGIPRLPKRAQTADKSAVCEGACAYAYLGGMYRWTASGSDRIGFPTYAAQQAPAEVSAYLKDMGISADALAASSANGSNDPVLWPDADAMITKGLANNGRQDLMATYTYSQGAPYLELKQIDRNGTHSITLLCKPGGGELVTYDTIGAVRARNIVGREEHSYFEINRQEVLPQSAGAAAEGESVVIRRTYPLNQLPQLASAQVMGAWVQGRGGLRYGFSFEVGGVRKILDHFTAACSQASQPQTQ